MPAIGTEQRSQLKTLQQNVLAISSLSNILSSSLGPNAHSKLIVDPNGKVIVSQDGAFILRQLQVTQPATRLLVDSVLTLDQLVGDGTTSTAILTSALIQKAYDCACRDGVSIIHLIKGYRVALKYIFDELFDELLVMQQSNDDTRENREVVDDRDHVQLIVRSCLSSKLTLHMDADKLSSLLTEALCHITKPFVHYRLHFISLLGQSVQESMLFHNTILLPSESLTTTKELKEDGRYGVVFIHGSIQRQRSRIKHTALLSTVEELEKFQIDEELEFEKQAKHILDLNVKVVIATGQIHRLVVHHLQKHGVLALALNESSTQSSSVHNFVCETLGCKMVFDSADLTVDHVGLVTNVKKIFFSTNSQSASYFLCLKGSDSSKVKTSCIVLRSGTKIQCEELLRHCHDVTHSVFSLHNLKKRRNFKEGFLPGGGAFEIQCALKLRQRADTMTGNIDSHGIKCFADSLEVIPCILCANAALDVARTMNELYAKHNSGSVTEGVPDLFAYRESTKPVYDSSFTKRAVLQIAADTACSILQSMFLFSLLTLQCPPKEHRLTVTISDTVNAVMHS